jgi:hypothetical protein
VVTAPCSLTYDTSGPSASRKSCTSSVTRNRPETSALTFDAADWRRICRCCLAASTSDPCRRGSPADARMDESRFLVLNRGFHRVNASALNRERERQEWPQARERSVSGYLQWLYRGLGTKFRVIWLRWHCFPLLAYVGMWIISDTGSGSVAPGWGDADGG